MKLSSISKCVCGLNLVGTKRNAALLTQMDGEKTEKFKGNLCASPASKSIISSHDFYCSLLVRDNKLSFLLTRLSLNMR